MQSYHCLKHLLVIGQSASVLKGEIRVKQQRHLKQRLRGKVWAGYSLRGDATNALPLLKPG